MHPLILLLVFAIASIVGYLIIKQVPPLLHTPLMSGMNALSGITVLGALAATGVTFLFAEGGALLLGQLLGGIAIIAATINIVGGYGVTHRMLKMFNKKRRGDKS